MGPQRDSRRAKYSKLTSAGRKALMAETAEWERLSTAISLIVKPAPGGDGHALDPEGSSSSSFGVPESPR
jgi:hypothetical protein